MIKKIISVLFFLLAVLSILGALANGTFTSNGYEPTAAVLGRATGTILISVIYLLSGLFLFRFDNVCKVSYIDGFKTRKKQSKSIIGFTVFYAFFVIIVAFGNKSSYTDNFMLNYLISVLPFFIPLLVFGLMFGFYVLPFLTCKKQFKYDDAMLNGYFSVNETFYDYSNDGSVLANSKVLFLHKIFCAFPLNQINSVKLINIAVEQDVLFTLTNGKKIEIISSKKQYDAILAAINANK